jgi:hypothetical protein
MGSFDGAVKKLEKFEEDLQDRTINMKALKELALIIKKHIDEVTDENVNEWSGHFKDSTKIVDKGKGKIAIVNDVEYATVIEYGHQAEMFVPFSDSAGNMKRFGEWAISVLGYAPTNRQNRKGYLMLERGGRLYSGLVVEAEERAPFRIGLARARPDVKRKLRQMVNGI